MTRCVIIRFQFSSVIRGHHVYSDIFTPTRTRQYSSRNSYDSFAAAIIENDTLASRVQFLALSGLPQQLLHTWTAAYPHQFVPFPRGAHMSPSYIAKYRPIIESSTG